jgi:dTDP-4-dehydrorhamnose 3,5-epimerase
VKYMPTDVDGVTIVDLEPHRDDRGFVSRSFCVREFAANGLTSSVVEMNISYNYTRGTVRGLHPDAGAKLVRCTRGAIVDVAVDVRPESPTYRKHVLVQLSADNRRALFVPPYVAHGFQTLTDHAEILCHVSGTHAPSSEQGFRWDDPEFGIAWPLSVSVISEKDANWPLVDPAASVPSR